MTNFIDQYMTKHIIGCSIIIIIMHIMFITSCNKNSKQNTCTCTCIDDGYMPYLLVHVYTRCLLTSALAWWASESCSVLSISLVDNSSTFLFNLDTLGPPPPLTVIPSLCKSNNSFKIYWQVQHNYTVYIYNTVYKHMVA